MVDQLPGTKLKVRGLDPNYQSSGPKLPPIPRGLYKAVLTEVVVWRKTEDAMQREALRYKKQVSELNPFQYVWFFHLRAHKRFDAIDPEDHQLKQFDTYDRELRSKMTYSSWNTSNAYKWVTKILGRELDRDEDFDPAALAGTRVLLEVSLGEPNESGFQWNNIESLVMPDEEDANWSIDPPENYVYGRTGPTPRKGSGGEDPPHPADVDGYTSPDARPPNVLPLKAPDKPLTEAQVKLRELFDKKGFTEEERKSAYTACCNEVFGSSKKFVEMGDGNQQLLMEHIENKYRDASEPDLEF